MRAIEVLMGGAGFELEISMPPFHADAACQEQHPGVTFFPSLGVSAAPAKRVCVGCLVRDECLAWALENDEAGIWGGTSDKERRALLRGRQAPAA